MFKYSYEDDEYEEYEEVQDDSEKDFEVEQDPKSRYVQQFNRDMELQTKRVALRTKLFLQLLEKWKPTLQQILQDTSKTNEEKAEYLLTTDVAMKIMEVFKKTPKGLKTILEGYLKSPNPESLITKITGGVGSAYEKEQLTKAREPLTKVVPTSILKYLPSKLVVDLDPSGNIVDTYTRFANKEKNLGVKIMKQKVFMKIKNNFEKILVRDIKSTDNEIKMKAIIIFIMYDTGIRPGKVGEGESTIREIIEGPPTYNEKKNTYKHPTIPVRVPTFGAISLQPEHFKLLEGVHNLAFYGKSGVMNKATITNVELNNVIEDILEKVANGQSGPLFVVEGKPFSNKDLQDYYIELLKAAGMKETIGHTLTDMRKLKSSTTLHQALLEGKKELDEAMLNIENVFSKEGLKILQETISKHILSAITKAEMALNHTSINMTVNSYINPKILLNYLQRSGDISEDFAEIIENEGVLKFNLQDFFLQVYRGPYEKFVNNEGWNPAVESGSLGLIPEQDEFSKQYSPFAGYRMAKLNKKVIVVDRIEGNKVVCRYGRSTFIMPLMSLPVGVKEGMSLEINLKPINTKFVKNKLNQIAQIDKGDTFHI
jgi:hypothetical protein